MTTSEALPTHATSEIPHVLDVDSHLRELREMPPVRRVHTLTGDEAWLVTGYAECRQLLLDTRLGRSHPDPSSMPQYAGNPMFDLVLAGDHDTSDEVHARVRAMLKPHFTPRRALDLRTRLEALADTMLDALVSKGPPADLHADFSVPFALRAICELLGVPVADRERCAELLSGLGNVADQQVARASMEEFHTYLRDLAAAKRADPDDGVLSALCAQTDDEEIAALAVLLMFTGLGSMVSQIDYGFLLWAINPEQREKVTRNPELLPKAVDEVLRMVGTLTLRRYARQDLEIHHVTIRTNELVLLDLTLANFDDQVFDHPERFDIGRSPNPHLTFSHGAWSCLASALVRVELQAAFGRLFARLPAVRPAVPLDQLRSTYDQISSGIADLQVTW
jgi:cytochrome P450 monooxygenase